MRIPRLFRRRRRQASLLDLQLLALEVLGRYLCTCDYSPGRDACPYHTADMA